MDQMMMSSVVALLAEAASMMEHERERTSKALAHERAIELQEIQAVRQRELAELTARLKRETSLQEHRERVRLDTYPLTEGPGHLREALRLLSPDLSDLPLLVMLAPFADEAGGSPWAGLREAIVRQLGRLEANRLITVRRIARPMSWPHPGLYWNDLYGIPTLLVEIGLDRQTLDVRLGGCHLVPGAASSVTSLRSVYTMTFPGADAWTDERVAALNATRPVAAQLQPPSTGENLLALNREFAARVITLAIASGVDAYHLMVRPRYEQQFDHAAMEAAIADSDWPADLGIPAEIVADPAFHQLHAAVRLARRSDADAAEQELLAALRSLAGHNGDRPDPALAGLAQAVADAGAAYIAKTTEVLTLLGDRPTLSGLAEHLAAVDPARLVQRFSAGRKQILRMLDHGAELARTLGPLRNALAATFADAHTELDTRRLHLVVTGPEGAGKSTLINALLGVEVAPISEAYPGTVAPVLFRYGDVDTPAYLVRFGRDKTRQCADGAEFADLLLQEHNFHNKEGVVSAEVHLRHPLLASGLILVDMPGLGGTSPQVTKAARQFLHDEEANTTLVAVYEPRRQTAQLRDTLKSLSPRSRLRTAAIIANPNESDLRNGDAHYRSWMSKQRAAVEKILRDDNLCVPPERLVMVNLLALANLLPVHVRTWVDEVTSHTEQMSKLRQAIWLHVRDNGVDAVLEQARATVRAILTELSGLAKARATLLGALVWGDVTEDDIECQLAAATEAADHIWHKAFSDERVERSAEAAWPEFARKADKSRHELLDAIVACENQINSSDRVTGDDITKQQITMNAAIAEAQQQLEDAAKTATVEMISGLVDDLDVALETFFAEMPLMHNQLSGTFSADSPVVWLPRPTADSNDNVSGVAAVGGGIVGGTLGGGSGIALLVGVGLTPFGAALLGAAGAAAVAGLAAHWLRGGNKGKARRALDSVRRSVSAELDTGLDGPLHQAWQALFDAAGSAVDELYQSRLDKLGQLVRDPSRERTALDNELAGVTHAATEIDGLRRQLDQPGFGRADDV